MDCQCHDVATCFITEREVKFVECGDCNQELCEDTHLSWYLKLWQVNPSYYVDCW